MTDHPSRSVTVSREYASAYEAGALAHQRSTGHEIEVLDNCVADAIRVEWSRQ